MLKAQKPSSWNWMKQDPSPTFELKTHMLGPEDELAVEHERKRLETAFYFYRSPAMTEAEITARRRLWACFLRTVR